MKERRYKEDYSFETQMDPRGCQTRSVVYCGEWYRYDGCEPEKRKTLQHAGLCLLFCTSLYFSYMKLGTPSTSCMYVLPVACCAVFALAYWTMGLFSMLRSPLKMTRVQRENGIGRVLRSAAGCMMLLCAAGAGDAVYMLLSLKSRASEEFAGFALLLCAAACAYRCMTAVKDVYRRMHTENAKDSRK